MMTDHPTTQVLLQRSDVLDFGPNKMVSSVSMFTDPVWRLDSDEPGHSASGIGCYWEPGLTTTEGKRVADCIVSDCRKFIWTGLADVRLTSTRKVSSVPSVMTGVTSLMRFMEDNRMISFADWKPDDTERYVDHLIATFVKEEADAVAARRDDASQSYEAVAEASDRSDLSGRIKSRISILDHIWRARSQLRKAGVPVPRKDPLSGRSASSVAGYAVDAIEDAIPPLPDEVFVAVINGVQQIVETHGPEVLKAQDVWFAETGGIGTHAQRERAKSRLADFRFDTAGETQVRWPDRLTSPMIQPPGSPTPTLGLRNLVVALRDGCCLLVLATTGMRLSEMMTIRSGWKQGAEFPDCIVVRKSDDGLLDLLFVVGSVLKHRDAETDEEWLIGSRAAGSTHVPVAVLAIMTLERLMAPWRDLSTDLRARERLCVSFLCPGFPLSGGSIGRFTKHRLATSIKILYERFIDFSLLPDFGANGTDLRSYRISGDRQIRVHQYRKNYGQFMMRTDSRLLPSLKRQFKHMHAATTQTYYVGNDLRTIAGLEDERRLAAGRALADILNAGGPTAGRLPRIIARHEPQMPDRPLHGRFVEVDVDTLSVGGGVLMPSEYGWCASRLAPHLARCNALTESASFLNVEPDLKQRSATTCLGCRMFLIDASNIAFWSDRLAKAERTLQEAASAARRLKDPSILDDYAAARAIASQARAVLAALEGRKALS